MVLQGGQIASDAFCGGSGGIFTEAEPLPVELVDESGEYLHLAAIQCMSSY